MNEAERWFARLSAPDCSTAERLTFEQWRAAPENAAAFAATEELCRSLSQLATLPQAQPLMARVMSDSQPRARLDGKRWAFALAASVTIVASAALYLALTRDKSTETYTTGTGQRSVFRLADGSKLVLNAATRIDVKMAPSERHFTLHQGEALFDVAQDPSRPFTVATAGSTVTALGTRFIVRSEGERTVVTLLEGRVAIERRDGPDSLQLNPGEQVRFNEAAPAVTRRSVDPDVAASWTTGRLKFRATPLAEVVDEVNRYSKTRIRLGDSSLAATPVSGTFELDDQDSMVAAVKALLPIDVDVQERGEIVLIRRSQR